MRLCGGGEAGQGAAALGLRWGGAVWLRDREDVIGTEELVPQTEEEGSEVRAGARALPSEGEAGVC